LSLAYTLIESVKDPIQFLFPSIGKLPASWFPYRRKFVAANEQLVQLLGEIVETRKQEIIENKEIGHAQDMLDKDLLTMLISATLNRDEPSSYITETELISNLGIFYAAGHEVSGLQ
jgi:cytochrome P450